MLLNDRTQILTASGGSVEIQAIIILSSVIVDRKTISRLGIFCEYFFVSCWGEISVGWISFFFNIRREGYFPK
jgi:hypothetical protein